MSHAHRPTTVVFDLGGVLIDWNPRYLYRSIFAGDEAAMERFLEEVVTAEWNAEQDAGRSWADAIEALVAKHPQHRAEIEAFWERWVETLGDALWPTVAIVEELREAGSVRLLALTNWSRETFPLGRPRYPFLEWFEAIVVSGDVRLAKPDPRIFRHLLDTFELDPARTVFIDDAPANVETAASLGMVAIRFTDADALRSRLVELGLLPAVPARSPAPSAGAGATPA